MCSSFRNYFKIRSGVHLKSINTKIISYSSHHEIVSYATDWDLSSVLKNLINSHINFSRNITKNQQRRDSGHEQI